MARSGLTKSQVRTVRDRMLADGKYPSVDAVRRGKLAAAAVPRPNILVLRLYALCRVIPKAIQVEMRALRLSGRNFGPQNGLNSRVVRRSSSIDTVVARL